jgi:hypothetical protein
MAVYVAMRADKFVKIGTSDDPKSRLRPIASEYKQSMDLAKEYMNAAMAEWQHPAVRAEWQEKDAGQ